jgi:hypothetical protein
VSALRAPRFIAVSDLRHSLDPCGGGCVSDGITKVRTIIKQPGQRDLLCTGCERRARTLCWLEHEETELPLTMPLCSDCFKDAAQRVTALLAENSGEDFGNHPRAA